MSIVLIIVAVVSLLLSAEFFFFNLKLLSLCLLVVGLLALVLGIVKARASREGDAAS